MIMMAAIYRFNSVINVHLASICLTTTTALKLVLLERTQTMCSAGVSSATATARLVHQDSNAHLAMDMTQCLKSLTEDATMILT